MQSVVYAVDINDDFLSFFVFHLQLNKAQRNKAEFIHSKNYKNIWRRENENLIDVYQMELSWDAAGVRFTCIPHLYLYQSSRSTIDVCLKHFINKI